MSPRCALLFVSIAGLSLPLLACRDEGAARAGEIADLQPSPAVKRLAATPPELGLIAWQRDYEAGLARARASGQPVLLLFDEVPGCATVNAFGREVLSHPLVVNAAEKLFVPIAIYNNAGGADRRVLERWGEPAWNNPVIRFINGSERELAPRLTHERGVAGVLTSMQQALRQAGRPVPEWLKTPHR